MPSINRLSFFTFALSLILSLFCHLLERTTFASRNLHCAQHTEDHSPAYKEGMNAFSNNDYEKAAEHFKQAAADKPDDMWAFYYFGLSLLKLKRFDEAANAYRQALAIKPEAAAVHYQLCKIYLEMGDREAAKKEYSLLQEHDREMASYLPSHLLSADPPTRQIQKAPVSSVNNKPNIEPIIADLRPTVTHKEKAKYTEIARINLVQGAVVLQVVFAVDGEVQNIRVVRSLPDGLTEKAIEAVRKIRFNPANKDGKPVSVQGKVEFVFNLY